MLHRPTEDDEVIMYEILRESMRKKGILQYEISNFAKPGFESKHNLNYWSNGYYYGFGAGAHGYLPGKRITNIRPLPAYVKKTLEDGKPILEEEKITLKEQIEEEIFLGLRRRVGLNKHAFHKKYGFSIYSLYKEQIRRLVSQDLLVETEDVLRLTNDGMLLANRVFTEFMLEEHVKI